MRILIAEDDRASNLLLTRTLEGWGHEVLATANGREAWYRFRAEPVSVVITDWMMPDMNGIELCRKIRAVDRPEYTYILILTSLEGKGRYLEGMDAGADDYVVKPFDREELAARLRVCERILGLKQHVSRLEGLLPICSYCKKIRDDAENWTNVENYVATRSDAAFTHSICPHCYQTKVEAELEKLSG